MKRLIPLLLTLVLLGSLAACGKDKNSDNLDLSKLSPEFTDPTFAISCEEEAKDLTARLTNLELENFFDKTPTKSDAGLSNFVITCYKYKTASEAIQVSLYETKNTGKMCLISLSADNNKLTEDERKLLSSLAGVLLDSVNNGEDVEPLLTNLQWSDIFSIDSEKALLTYAESQSISARVQYFQGAVDLVIEPKANK